MKQKPLMRILAYFLVTTIIFSFFTSITNAAFENTNFIKVTRISDSDKAVLNEEKDITYRITGEEYSLVINNDVLMPKEIMLVIDVSGSMSSTIGNGDNRIRLNVLKTAAINFVDNFATKNVKIAYTTYSYSSNSPTQLYNMKTPSDVTTLKYNINHLSANGSTNMGDGIRRGYYDLAGTNTDAMKYMVIMTDGEPNYFTSNSRISNYNANYNTNYDSNMKTSSGEATYTYGQNNNQGLSYAKKTANLVKNNGDIGSYVVGFSSGSYDSQLEAVGVAAGSKANPATGNHFYKAITGDEMLNIYNTIAQDIDSELGFKSATFDELLPLGVEPVIESLPAGFTATLQATGRYKVTGNVTNLKLVKLQNGKYQVQPVDINIRVKFNTVGLKTFGADEGKITYVDPFNNNKTTIFLGQFNVTVGNPLSGVSKISDLTVEKGKIDKATVTVIRGDSGDIANTNYDVTAEIVLASGNTNTADLTKVSIQNIVKNNDGTIDVFVKGMEVINTGKIKINVVVNDNVTNKVYNQQCDVKVFAKLTSVGQLSDLKIEKNSTQKASVTITPPEASDVTYQWQIDDSSLAEITGKSFNTDYNYDSSGKIEADVKGLKNGTTKLRLVVKDKYSQDSITKVCTLKVGESLGNIGTLTDKNIQKNSTDTFEVIVSPATPSNVRYKWKVGSGLELIGLQNDTYCDYDKSGKIKATVKGVLGGDSTVELHVIDDFSGTVVDRNCNVHVYTALDDVTLPTNMTIVKGTPKVATAVLTPTDASDISVEWFIIEGATNAKVVYPTTQVGGNLNATIEGLDVGTAKLELNVKDKITGKIVIKYCDIKIGIPINDVTLPTDIKILKGSEGSLKALIKPVDASDYAVEWSVIEGNTNVSIKRTNKSDGTLEAVLSGDEVGTAKVNFLLTDSISGESWTKVCNIKVGIKVNSIVLPENLKIIKGQTGTAIATLNPLEATDYTYKWELVEGTSNASIESEKNSNGSIEAVINGDKIGNAMLKLTVTDNMTDTVLPAQYVNIEIGMPIDSVNALTDVSINQYKEKIVTVKINPATAPITKDNFSVTLVDGTVAKAEIVDVNGSIFNDGVVKIKVKGLKAGETKLNVKVTDNFDYDLDGKYNIFEKSCTIKVWNIDIQ